MANGNEEYFRGPPKDVEGMVSLKVDNLTYRTTVDDLQKVFDRYGKIGDVYIPRSARGSRGFAFVRFFNKRDAEDAMRGLDGSRLDGREIRIQLARYARPETGRGGGGGGGGDRDRDRDRGDDRRRDDRGGDRRRDDDDRRRSPVRERRRSLSPVSRERRRSRSPIRRYGRRD